MKKGGEGEGKRERDGFSLLKKEMKNEREREWREREREDFPLFSTPKVFSFLFSKAFLSFHLLP